VIDDLGAREGPLQGGGLEEIAAHRLGAGGRQRRPRLLRPGQRPHRPASRDQALEHRPAHEAGAARDEDRRAHATEPYPPHAPRRERAGATRGAALQDLLREGAAARARRRADERASEALRRAFEAPPVDVPGFMTDEEVERAMAEVAEE
jgi:hypothetical protein